MDSVRTLSAATAIMWSSLATAAYKFTFTFTFRLVVGATVTKTDVETVGVSVGWLCGKYELFCISV